MSTLKNITVIIVTYNSDKEIINLVKSLKFIKTAVNEVIIIDNNSIIFETEKIKKISKKIKIIQNKQNVGFAKAVNQGIKVSKSNFILLLNPDTYLEDNSIIKTFNLINKNSKIGAMGGKIFYTDNRKYYTANTKPNFLTGIFEFTNLKKFFPKNIFSKKFWPESYLDFKKPTEVDSLCGAYLIFRKKINNELNLFDENYFLYLEDLEFGATIKEKGYKVIFDPNSYVKHIGGASSNNKYKTSLKYWYKSRKIFFKKHLNLIEGIILTTIFSLEEIFLDIYHYIKHDSI
jgi:GT2 family glycosyltransferase